MDASILPPLQKRILRGELEKKLDDLKAKAEKTKTPSPQPTPNPDKTPLPQLGPGIPVLTPVPYPKNGEVAYIFYTDNPDADFSKQAEYQKKQLEKQGYEAKLVCTNDVTAFSDAWNSMSPKTGAAVIISHSNGMSLIFEHNSTTNAISATGLGSKNNILPSIGDLHGPDVGILYLYACNAGHEELFQEKGINVAAAFSDLSTVDTVFAYDGSVGFGIPILRDIFPDFFLDPRLASDQDSYYDIYKKFGLSSEIGTPSGLIEYTDDD